MSRHDNELLGAYLLGVLDEREQAAVRDHLGVCAACRREVDALRETEAAMGGIPPEALVEGPPDDGDLLLQRTLRQARQERSRARTRRRAAQVAAAVVTGAAVLAGGMLGGRALVTESAAPITPATAAPGTRTATATDAATGATMTVALQPADGWVRLRASVGGVSAGEQCRLVVISRDGTRREAGTWRVSAQAADAATSIDGTALVALPDVAAVQVETLTGRKLVKVAV